VVKARIMTEIRVHLNSIRLYVVNDIRNQAHTTVFRYSELVFSAFRLSILVTTKDTKSTK